MRHRENGNGQDTVLCNETSGLVLIRHLMAALLDCAPEIKISLVVARKLAFESRSDIYEFFCLIRRKAHHTTNGQMRGSKWLALYGSTVLATNSARRQLDRHTATAVRATVSDEAGLHTK